VGDYDNDGFLDLFMANYPGVNGLHRNLSGQTFTNVAESAGLAQAMASWSGAWGDYDNDGFQDLFVVNWQRPNALFHNNGDGTFTSVDIGSPIRDGFSHAYAGWVDYDNDGSLDLFISNGFDAPDRNLLYHNNGNANHWFKVKLAGTASNRSAIGRQGPRQGHAPRPDLLADAEISGNSSSSGWQGLIAHFGLGDATIIDTVRIEWPSGAVQELRGVAVKQVLTVVEPPRLGGLALQADGSVRLNLIGAAGVAFRVEASSIYSTGRRWSPSQTARGQNCCRYERREFFTAVLSCTGPVRTIAHTKPERCTGKGERDRPGRSVRRLAEQMGR